MCIRDSASFLINISASIISSWFLSESPLHRYSAHPCLCKARVRGRREFQRQLVRLAGTLQHDVSLCRRFNFHTGRHLVRNRMGIAQSQVQGITGSLCAITYAYQSQLALETLTHTQHHVRQQRSDRAGHRIGLRGVVLRFAQQAVALAHHAHVTRQCLLQGTQRALYRNFTRSQRDFDTARHYDRILGNSRHAYLTTRLRTALRHQYRWRALCGRSSNPWRSTRWQYPGHSSPWEYHRNPYKYAVRDD